MSWGVCGIVLTSLALGGCDAEWSFENAELNFLTYRNAGTRQTSPRYTAPQRPHVADFDETVDRQPVMLRLGKLSAGQRLTISVNLVDQAGPGPRVGLFNSAEEALVVDSRLSNVANQRETLFETDIRATDEYFIGLALPADANSPRRVTGKVTYATPATSRTKTSQTLLLDFSGGSVRVGGKQYEILPFDAVRIDPSYAGQTELIKTQILAHVRAAFAGTRITIRSSDEPMPVVEPHATLHFGGANSVNLGISQHLDAGNKYCCDRGLIFTDQMSKHFAFRPGVEQISTVIANVACHETGHLLGLTHTDNPGDFMDIAANQNDLLVFRRFMLSPLHDAVFPLGLQNGPALLQINLTE